MVDASSMSFRVCHCSSNYGGSIHPRVQSMRIHAFVSFVFGLCCF
jgi:hypothetical protein